MWATIASCVAFAAALLIAPAPAQASATARPAATTAASITSSSSCVAYGAFNWCRTNAVQAHKEQNWCVTASVGALGFGNMYDVNGDHVGPWNFTWGSTTVCGLYNRYYLVVQNYNIPPYVTGGTISG
jgi:hypothetical protein